MDERRRRRRHSRSRRRQLFPGQSGCARFARPAHLCRDHGRREIGNRPRPDHAKARRDYRHDAPRPLDRRKSRGHATLRRFRSPAGIARRDPSGDRLCLSRREIREAHERMESNRGFGKIVLTFS